MRKSPRIIRAGLRVVCVTAVAMLSACGNTNQDDASDFVNLDRLPTFVLEETTRIGSVADPDVGFSSIGQVDVDRDGNLLVFEARDLEIRVYSSEGELLRSFGGPGDGPGEFAAWTRAFGVLGDTVWVYDSRANRLTVFDRMGRLLGANRVEEVRVTLHDPQQTAMIWPAQMGTDGLLIGDRGSTSVAGSQQGGAISDTVFIPRVRFNLMGRIVDTIGSYPVPRSPSTEIVSAGSSRYILPRAPGVKQLVGRTPEGLIIIDQGDPPISNTFRVTWKSHVGDVAVDRTLQYDPKPFPAAVLESAVVRSSRSGTLMALTSEGIVRIDRNPADSAQAVRVIRREMVVPDAQYPVRSVMVSRDGMVWLQREYRDDESQIWTILEGETLMPVGEVVLASNQRPAWIDRHSAWIVENDNLGIPWMVRYEIRESQ